MIVDSNLELAVFSNSTFLKEAYIESAIYVEYTVQYKGGSSFKIVCERSYTNAAMLKKGKIIWIEDDICGLIHYVKVNSESTIECGGTLCDKLLTQRIILEAFDVEGYAIEALLSRTLQAQIEPLPNFSYTFSNLPSASITGTISPQPLNELVEDLIKAYDFGYKIRKVPTYNNQLQLLITFYAGTDKSSQVVMSKEFESISDFEYTESNQDEITFVRVMGAEDISIDVSTGATGYSRKDAYLDCTNIPKGDKTLAEYTAILTEKGQKYIQEHRSRDTYSGNFTGLTFRYGVDYNVGDIVSVRDKETGVSTEQVVTEFRKQFDSSGKYAQLSFGEVPKSVPIAISSLAKKVEKLENTPVDSMPETGNGLTIDEMGKLILKLGEGVKFDNNGALTLDIEPVVNIEYGLVYTR